MRVGDRKVCWVQSQGSLAGASLPRQDYPAHPELLARRHPLPQIRGEKEGGLEYQEQGRRHCRLFLKSSSFFSRKEFHVINDGKNKGFQVEALSGGVMGEIGVEKR